MADSYFDSVALLLHFGGSDGSTTFTDSGPGLLSLSAANSAQISTAQSAFGGSSLALNGTGAMVVGSITPTLAFGTGDFTIEFAARKTATGGSGYDVVLDTAGNGSGNGGIIVELSATRGFVVFADGASVNLSYSCNPNDSTWHHYAICRSGTTLRLFIDGAQVASTTNSHSIASGSALRIGAVGSSAQYPFAGHIDEFRITTGVARYTANFTVPSSAHWDPPDGQDPFFGSVSLLVTGGGTSGATTFADSSTHAHAVTTVGDTQYSNVVAGYAGNPIKFDGTGDNLSIAASSAFNLGAGDWTLEGRFWAVSASVAQKLFVISNGSIARAQIYISSGGALGSETNNSAYSHGGTVPAGAWFHAAATRKGNVIRVFLNGAQVSTHNESATLQDAVNVVIGHYPSGAYYFNGYVDFVRVTKGVARYTANFVAPDEAPWEPSPTQDFYFDNVVALLHFEGSDGSTTITDSCLTPQTLTAYGNAQLTTTYHDLGGSALTLDGNDDYVQWSTALAAAAASEDFTVELSVRATSSDEYGQLLTYSSATPNVQVLLNYLTPKWWNYPGTSISISGPGAVTQGVWSKIALVRSAGVVRMYLDGVGGTPVTYAGALEFLRIGSFNGAVEFFQGQIDELRITKGVARYLSNYTPSTVAFPDTGTDPLPPISAEGANTVANCTQTSSATVVAPIIATGANTVANCTQVADATALMPISATGANTVASCTQTSSGVVQTYIHAEGSAAWLEWVYQEGTMEVTQVTHLSGGNTTQCSSVGAAAVAISMWVEDLPDLDDVWSDSEPLECVISVEEYLDDVESQGSARMLISVSGANTVITTTSGTAAVQTPLQAQGSATVSVSSEGTMRSTRVLLGANATSTSSDGDATVGTALRPKAVTLSVTSQGSATHPVQGAQTTTLAPITAASAVRAVNRAAGANTAAAASTCHASVRVRAHGACTFSTQTAHTVSAPTPMFSTATAYLSSLGAMTVRVTATGGNTVRVGTMELTPHGPFHPAANRYWRSA